MNSQESNRTISPLKHYLTYTGIQWNAKAGDNLVKTWFIAFIQDFSECLPIRKFWCIFCKYFNPAFRKFSVHFLSLLYSRVKKTSNKLFQRKGNYNLSLQIKFCFTFRLLCSWCVSPSFFSKQNWKESMEALYMRKRTHKLHTDTFKAEITNTKQFCTRNN